MAYVIKPVACDDHEVYSLHDERGFVGLYCEDCDAEYPAQED
jgi:hypothetical protein